MADGGATIIGAMPVAFDTDETLVARFAAGDEAAFASLYERHELPLWRYLLRRCGDRAAAEELMQETWFAVSRESARFRKDGRFQPWLYTIARHRVIDRYRAAQPVDSLDATDAGHDEPRGARLPDDTSPSPLARSEQAEQAAAILAALARLPVEQREAFVLQVDAGLDVADIARVTGTTFETAKSRLRYARDKLKALLREHAP
jgi:RNA polymerase sigma factor (sigma-70 family)